MMSFAVLAVVKATLICGVAFTFSRVCRHTRASIRHLLFALAFAGLVIIPPGSAWLPPVALRVPAATATSALLTRETAPAAVSGTSAELRDTSASAASRHNSTASPIMGAAQIVAAIWFVGVALSLLPVLAGLWQVRRLRLSALSWGDQQAVVRSLASTFGVRRSIEVRLHEKITGPMACGLLRPSIILPDHARHWDEASLRCALKHEIEHVARWDFLSLCLSRIVCAAYWFHPLVWAAWRRLRLEAERACDDAVLQHNDATDYASLLIAIAQREAPNARYGVLAMAGRDDLAARVAAMLDKTQARGRVDRLQAVPLILTATLVILGVAPITVARAMPQTDAAMSAASRLRFETVSVTRNRNNDRSLMYVTDNAGGKPGVGPDGLVQWMTAINGTVRVLLSWAYNSEVGMTIGIGRLHEIDNAPAWIDSDGFDVVAKAPFRATSQQMNEMLQSLLAERFKLKAHVGSKDVPIYALIRTQSSGNPGPRMSPSQADCGPRPGAASVCGLSGTSGRLVGRGMTMAQLVELLPKHLIGGHHIAIDRAVIDKTGLSGTFDFALEWTPDPVSRERGPFQFFAFPVESTAPNFVAALQEQLGLMLETQWVPQPVLIVDRIEPPSEN
jgi:uncharacterized protein (TIGR03435 family)